MKKLLCVLAAVAALGFARAADQDFTIVLDTASAGGGARTGSGDGTMTLHDNNSINYLLSYNGLPSARTVVGVYSQTGLMYVLANQFQQGGASEALLGMFNLVNGRGGFTLTQQRSQLNLGQWYVGVSTAEFPAPGDMDLRGQIAPNIIPEPGTWSLLAIGAAGLALRLRRK